VVEESKEENRFANGTEVANAAHVKLVAKNECIVL
jgi:hypothetical protein